MSHPICFVLFCISLGQFYFKKKINSSIRSDRFRVNSISFEEAVNQKCKSFFFDSSVFFLVNILNIQKEQKNYILMIFIQYKLCNELFSQRKSFFFEAEIDFLWYPDLSRYHEFSLKTNSPFLANHSKKKKTTHWNSYSKILSLHDECWECLPCFFFFFFRSWSSFSASLKMKNDEFQSSLKRWQKWLKGRCKLPN